MISIRKVTIRRGGATVLDDISLDVREGKIVTIIGGSGCGKSTLLRAVMRLLPVSAGEILVDGQRINGLREREMDEVRKKMGMVFQEGALFDSMTVGENVAFALRRHTRESAGEIKRIVSERLDAVGLEDSASKRPDQLSGGMKRRVAIARALALRPKIMLYDEPTTGLDPILTETILDLITRMRERYQTTSLLVTHDLDAAVRISDRIAMIGDGRVVDEGDAAHMKNSSKPIVRSFFRAESCREVNG